MVQSINHLTYFVIQNSDADFHDVTCHIHTLDPASLIVDSVLDAIFIGESEAEVIKIYDCSITVLIIMVSIMSATCIQFASYC